MFWLNLKNYWLSLSLLLKLVLSIPLLVIIFVLSFFFINLSAPSDFPGGTMYTVKNGTGLRALAGELSEKKIIKSPFLFKSFSVILGGTKGVLAGDYVLTEKENVFALAKRMTSGDYRLERIKITLPEGLNIFEMAKLISAKFSKISENDFIEKAKKLEGYLFPDTYIFQTNTGVYTVIEEMQENFDRKIKSVSDQIKSSGKSVSDIVKMASIIEEEARTTESRQVVAGILWKRLSLGMPLQVDSSFKYINGKGTKDLSLDDLKIDSPYNSYLYKGLPPTPICNPGLDSIRAALTPIQTAYLYFLTDKEGNMHYAKTFQEHILNKQKYLP